MNKGNAFVLSGPSGSGKDTVMKLALEKVGKMEFSISCVTRAKRGNEAEDGKYRFLSVAEFEELLAQNALHFALKSPQRFSFAGFFPGNAPLVYPNNAVFSLVARS